MNSKQIIDSSTSSSILGRSSLQQQMSREIQLVVPDLIETAVAEIDESIQSALDKVITEGGDIIYEPKPVNQICDIRPNTGNVNFNNYRLENLASVPDLTSIESILATPSTACNVTTASNLITLNLALNTAYCGPLLSTMDLKGKRVTNMADAELITLNDPQAASKIKQGVNLGTLNSIAVTTVPEDRNNFYASNKQIKEGLQATENGDFVVKEQTITEEVKELQYQVGETVVGGPYKHYMLQNNNTVYTVSDPKSDPTGLLPSLTIKNSVPTQTIDKNLQIANLKYVDSKVDEEVKKRHSKTADVDLVSTYRVVNMPDPTASHHGVNKSYCDSNSSKDPSGTGNFFSTLFGAISGAISGAVASFATQGLASGFGSSVSGLVSAFGAFNPAGLFQAGIRTGSSAGLESLKAVNPLQNEGALIDNLKSDIANRPPGDPDAGSLVSGAMSVGGLFRAVRNAQIGLFEVIP